MTAFDADAVRCEGTLGSKPTWMGWGQYDPCRCALLCCHDGPHWCDHLGSSRPVDNVAGRTARHAASHAASHAPSDLAAALARIDELEAECERHRKARLVRAVVDGWGDRDEWISEVIAKTDWDAVPWMVAEKMRAENARLLAAAEGARRGVGQ